MIGIQILFGKLTGVKCGKDLDLCHVAIVIELLAAKIAREVQHG